jgi:hypothetical protein
MEIYLEELYEEIQEINSEELENIEEWGDDFSEL